MSEEQDKEVYAESLRFIKGVPITTSFNEDNIRKIFEFEPKDGDIIIASYPKTGTTWMQYIVLQILTKAESFPTFEELLHKVVPFLEMSGVSVVEESTQNPRVYKHHMPYNSMKKNPRSKVIYTYRKPEDTLVSYYHFLKQMRNIPLLDLEEHFNNFMSGTISYGRYFEHVLSYLEHESDGNVLLVSYEKLKNHTKEEVLRVAKFLGEEYHDILVKEESILNKIIENTSFEHMKKNLILKTPDHAHSNKHSHSNEVENVPKKEVNFFRKGVVGDGKNTLTKEQLRKIEEIAEDLMKETKIFDEWYNQGRIKTL